VGFSTGDSQTGEILVLAVLPHYEGMGIGKGLLSRVVDWLLKTGAQRVWLAASSEPTVRAYGFYRTLGWQLNGEHTANGDEILELHTDAIRTRRTALP
jgi:GNAT superfamily N-acetyltransferase